MTQPVIRLTARCAFLAGRLAASEGRTVPEFLHNLVEAYAKGLSFEDDPDLDRLPAPPAELHVR